MKTIKLLKFISMSLVTTILIAFTFTSFASAAEVDSQPKVSEQKAQAQKALEDLKTIKNMDITNVTETSEKKEFTLVIDNEENQITYDKNAGELYVDGQLAVTDITIEEHTVKKGDSNSISALSASSYKTYTIGTNYGSGTWINTGYKTGSFNVGTVTVAAVVGAISLILTKKPTASALNSAASGIISSLIAIDQYQVLWSLWSYKDKNKAFYQDSLTLFNYKGRSAENIISKIIHYWGVIN